MADRFSINYWENRSLVATRTVRWILYFGHIEAGDEARWLLYYNPGAFSEALTANIPRNWEIISMGESYG
jgi:hypothetical protein